MRVRGVGLQVLALFGVLAACGDSGDESTADNVRIEDAEAICDATADLWDDLFIFKAWTANAVAVTFTVKDGGSELGAMALDEEDDGYWYREVWADDLGTDCDAFNSLRFLVTADGANGSTDDTELR